MPGARSRRYSPASFEVVVWIAPVALLTTVMSADLITAWVLSATVPCRVAFAVACPHMAAQLNSIKLPMSAINNHRLRFIPFFLLQVVVASNATGFGHPTIGAHAAPSMAFCQAC